MRAKKITAAVLSVVLLLVSLTSCFFNPFDWFGGGSSEVDSSRPIEETRQLFDEMLAQDFLDYATSDTLTLHFTIKDRASFGITDHEASWGDLSVYPSEQNLEKDQAFFDEFKTIDRSHLTEEQQQSYDIIAYDREYFDTMLDTWYYGDPFTGSTGTHLMMPVTLAEYDFFNEQDVVEYLVLIETLGDYYDMLLAFEAERAAQGLMLPDWALGEVISGCDTFLEKRDTNIFITSFNDRIDEMDSLSASQKSEYKTKNRELFNDVVVPSYERIAEAFEGFKGSGENDGGLANLPKGKEYYSYRLQSMGSSKTPEELIELSDKLLKENWREQARILRSSQEVYDAYLAGYEGNPVYVTPEMSGEQIMDYLAEECMNDFPTMPPGISYSLTPIDDAIKDTVSPAFYFVPRVDDYTKNSIYFNAERFGGDRDYMFFTLAHEGYPGHLLQNVTVMASSLPDWRKVQSYSTYSEGWATYTERYVYKYLDVSEDYEKYLILDDDFYLLLDLRLDLGVNYEGWTREDLRDYIVGSLGEIFIEEAYDMFYDFCVKDPLRNVPYVIGLIEIRELREYYQEELGSDYTDKLFHETIVQYGEMPFELLKKWMDWALLGKTPR